MTGLHPLADLAPRDVVAKAIMNVMAETGTDHVYLDGTHLGEDVWEHRFPTIRASCLSHGIDPVSQPIPVVPAAHYASGGVKTDLHGRTNIPGLYACGEAACTGVHGANRLASNSLLEGLVFAERIAADLASGVPPRKQPADDDRIQGLIDPGAIDQIQHLMTERAGVLVPARACCRRRCPPQDRRPAVILADARRMGGDHCTPGYRASDVRCATDGDAWEPLAGGLS
jgi:aspartate oxidase